MKDGAHQPAWHLLPEASQAEHVSGEHHGGGGRKSRRNRRSLRQLDGARRAFSVTGRSGGVHTLIIAWGIHADRPETRLWEPAFGPQRRCFIGTCFARSSAHRASHPSYFDARRAWRQFFLLNEPPPRGSAVQPRCRRQKRTLAFGTFLAFPTGGSLGQRPRAANPIGRAATVTPRAEIAWSADAGRAAFRARPARSLNHRKERPMLSGRVCGRCGKPPAVRHSPAEIASRMSIVY